VNQITKWETIAYWKFQVVHTSCLYAKRIKESEGDFTEAVARAHDRMLHAVEKYEEAEGVEA
jgi:hypothetical protein